MAEIDIGTPVAMQRPRCDCCPPLQVDGVGTYTQISVAMGGFADAATEGYNPNQFSGPYATIDHYYLNLLAGPDGTGAVSYNPRNGVFSPSNPPNGSSYQSPVFAAASYLSNEFTESLLTTILGENEDAAAAAQGDQTALSLTGNLPISASYATSGYANFTASEYTTGSTSFYTSSVDVLTNNTSRFQRVFRNKITNFHFRVTLPKPHISGSYKIQYRFLTHEVHLEKHNISVLNLANGDTSGSSTTDTVNTETYTFSGVTTLVLTPSEGDTTLDSEEIAWPTPTIGQTITIVGPPGSPDISYIGGQLGGSVGKTGFLQRTQDDTGIAHVYLIETATGAGCGGSQTWDATQIGIQGGGPLTDDFTGPVDASFKSPGYPNTGSWSLSPPPFKILTPTVAKFSISGATDLLVFTLSDEYTTAALQSPIDTLIASDPVANAQPGFRCEQHLADDESFYRQFVGYLIFDFTLVEGFTRFADLGEWTANFTAQWDQLTIAADGTQTIETKTQVVTFTPAAQDINYPAYDEDGTPHPLAVEPPDGCKVIIQNLRYDPPTDDRICPPVLAYAQD